jgi:hypothetical protein
MASNYLREILSLEREVQKVIVLQGKERKKECEKGLKDLIQAKVKEQQV